MSAVNNLKLIRELYGATQEQVAVAVGVNRVTVANWENGNSTASASNQEKLSMYYGIGPEFFYTLEMDDTAKQMVISAGKRERKIVDESNGKRSKENEYHDMFKSITFQRAMRDYMFSMKMLLAKTDDGDIDSLETALLINKKMGARLNAIIELRKNEEKDGEPSMMDLIEQFDESN